MSAPSTPLLRPNTTVRTSTNRQNSYAERVSFYEAVARTRKAYALVELLISVGGDPDAAASMTDADWDLAARSAQVAQPSGKTRALVVEILTDRARRQQEAARA